MRHDASKKLTNKGNYLEMLPVGYIIARKTIA